MRFKNARFRRAHAFCDLALHFGNLLARLQERFFKAADFTGNLIFSQFTAGDDMPRAMKDENFPATNAGGNRDAAKNLFSFLLPVGHARQISESLRCGKAIPATNKSPRAEAFEIKIGN
jgi:hypothetical protein